MHVAEKPTRFERHANAFGFLRLLLACSVIASHVPEGLTGDRSREPLTLLTGSTSSLGGIAVYGFFVISGFLLTGSYLNSRSVLSYLRKRVARIYPGFIACSVVCLAIVAPLAGAHVVDLIHGAPGSLARTVILARPMARDVFVGQFDSDWTVALNGPLWTIQYEFTCYLLLMMLGFAGLLGRPRVIAALAAAFLIIGGTVAVPWFSWIPHRNLWPGSATSLFDLIGLYLAGSTLFLIQARVRLNGPAAVASAVALSASLFTAALPSFAFALFGSYLILYVAKRGGRSVIGRVNNRNDISYGVYLYAWPIEKLAILYLGSGHLWLILAATFIGSFASGWLSWVLVERPALRWLSERRDRVQPSAQELQPAARTLARLRQY